MSYSRVTYTGGQSAYAIPFPYLSRSHIRVYEGDTLSTASVTFNSETSISLTPDPGAAVQVSIRRVTPLTSALVEFSAPASVRDLTKAKLQALYAIQEITDGGVSGGGGGGGDGGPVFWGDILDKPSVWPGTIGFGSVTGISSGTVWAGTLPYSRVTALPTLIDAIDGLGLPPSGNKVIEFTPSGASFIDTPTGGGGGGGGSGNMQPRLLSDFGALDATGATTTANNAAITAAEASNDSAIYLPDGIYAKATTSPMGAALTKGYTGRGIFLEGSNALPAKFSYLGSKPSTWPVQGNAGWFRGDQKFTDGGEWKIIGPDVRRYDLTMRYFESNCIPHHAWFDVNSGNSGIQALLSSGAVSGSTVITLPQAADPNWVGKQVGFALNMDGVPLETKTVTAVNTAGNNITINTPLANTYTWNPGGGQVPCILFGRRTHASHTYVRERVGADGGGDVYGHIVRQITAYQPKPTETHTFMAGTIGQYGGDQYADTDGVYMTGWESQQHDNGHDIAAIGFVQSFVRDNDNSLSGGRFWAGTHFQSTGSRPGDVAHNILGYWRNGIDFTIGSFIETARLAANTTGGGTTFTVNSVNGARPGDTVNIGEPLAVAYSGVIQSVNTGTKTITVSPALPGSPIASGTHVRFINGGAALNLADNQRIVWGATVSGAARGGDPTGAFANFYGNQQGDIIMQSGSDGSGRYWSVGMRDPGGTPAFPDYTRIRIRANGSVQLFTGPGTGQVQGSGSIEAAKELVSNGLKTDGTVLGCVIFGAGLGVRIEYNGTNLRATKNNGGSWVNIV